MRIGWLMVAVLGLGCSVQLTGAPCADDLQCPKQQHCGPAAECVDGTRSEELVGESCRQAVRAVAERVSECLGSATEIALGVLGPEEVCRSVEGSVAAGRQDFRPEEFGACLRALRETPCGNLNLDKLALGTMLDGCSAFVAQVEQGGACANSADCQAGWCEATDACPGVCKPFVPYSGSCANGERCQEGSSCALNVCRRYAGLGGLCNGNAPCDPSTYCLEGHCVERATSGSCTKNEECAFEYACVKTQPAQGDSSPKECRPVKGLDESCEPGAGECAPLTFCDAGTRTCRAWPARGERCGDPSGNGESVLCSDGRCEFFGLPPVCLAYADVGAGCLTNFDCGPAGSCRGFRCVPIWCP